MGNPMKPIKQIKILDIIKVCPYCMTEVHERTQCCGESSAHFETAYVLEDEVLLRSDVDVIDIV